MKYLCNNCGIFFIKSGIDYFNPQFCSKECFIKYFRLDRVVSPKNKRCGKYKESVLQNKRRITHEVMLRDGNCCVICGRNDTRLNIHHKDKSQKKGNWKDANNNLDNLITVCSFCHSHIHSNKKTNYRLIDNLDEIKQMRMQGKTLQSIGDYYNVTRERIRQVIKKYHLT